MPNKFHYRISGLISKFIQGKLSTDELSELDQWMLDSEDNKQLFEELLSDENFKKRAILHKSVKLDQAYARFKANISDEPTHAIYNHKDFWLKRIAIAACIIAPLFIGLLYIVNKEKVSANLAQESLIKAGEKKAKLFLASGDSIVLSGVENDTIRKGQATYITGLGNVKYENETQRLNNKVNKLVVPRGGEYQIILSDGTHVWLNSETELSFPEAFNGPVRRVTLKGEAFFQVKEDKEHPFIVVSDNVMVKVLGTAFNIRNYKDEASHVTTLAEGSVQLISSEGAFQPVFLKPGYQSDVNYQSETVRLKKVNLDEYITWKDGVYLFKHQPLGKVMSELARWYNLEIEYTNDIIKNTTITGQLNRANSFNSFVSMIEKIEVAQFKIEGNRISISEK